eukprot:Em0021g974a
MICGIVCVFWLVCLRSTHQLAVRCDASTCAKTTIACSTIHPYAAEMARCFPGISPNPKTTPSSSKDCPSNVAQNQSAIGAPVNISYNLVSNNIATYKATIRWSMDTTDGLTGFNVRVFNEVSFADASVQGDFLLCLYLDRFTYSFSTDISYTEQPGARIRVEITSLPYNTSAIMNTNFVTFPTPASCQNILGSFPTTCYSPRYGSPSITVKPSHLLDKLGRLTGEMEVNVTWSSGIPGSMYPPPSHYFVMVAPSTVPISCQNIASTSCFITNETSVVLKPLNTSITYQVVVQSYTPCSNGPCSYPSMITRIRAPPPPSVSSVLHTTSAGIAPSTQPKPAILSPEVSMSSVVSICMALVVLVVVVVVVVVLVEVVLRYRRKKPSLLATDPDSPKTTSCASPSQERVFVSYSVHSTAEEKDKVMSSLISKLAMYGVNVSSHDFLVQRGVMAYTFEEEICQSSVVLCVCNKSFLRSGMERLLPRPLH